MNTVNSDKMKNQSESGCWKTVQIVFSLLGAIIIIPIIGIFMLIGTGLSSFGNIFQSIESIFVSEPARATVIPNRTIVSSLQPLGQLVSISVEVAQADIHVGVNTGGLNLCSHSAYHVAQGVVEAGVDITQVNDGHISYEASSDTYRISLPEPQITSCRIDYIRQYERSGGNVTCGIDWDSVRLLAQYETTVLFASDTLEAGIIDRAERETTLLMTSFIEALTGSQVEIDYLTSDENEARIDSSCRPQLPRGWTFDDETNQWVQTSE